MALYAVTQKMGERDPQKEMVYAFRLFDDDDTGRISLNVRPNTPPGNPCPWLSRSRAPCLHEASCNLDKCRDRDMLTCQFKTFNYAS